MFDQPPTYDDNAYFNSLWLNNRFNLEATMKLFPNSYLFDNNAANNDSMPLNIEYNEIRRYGLKLTQKGFFSIN